MARTLPIPPEHRELTVKVDGSVVSREHPLLAASVVHTLDRVPAARLVYQDGSPSSGSFTLSDSDLFVPGKTVEILGGTADDSSTLFKGVVVRHSVKVRERAGNQLVVECRHPAFKLTVGRKSAYWLDTTDADAISAILDAAGITPDVQSTSVQHPQLVQYQCTDWDFLLARAEATGMVVIATPDGVRVQAPDLSGEPVCDLHFGATILEMDATIDARTQLRGVSASTWDPASQAVVRKDAADPGIREPGNLDGDTLAGVVGLDALPLAHASVAEEEAQSWADATWMRSRLSRISGRAKCQGIGAVTVGCRVSLVGVGERFSGPVYVTGVRHELDLVQGWRTHVQFGSAEGEPLPARTPSPAGGLVPGVVGLQAAVVVSNEDPDGEHRVRVRLPLVSVDEDGTWARVASLDAGEERGFFFRPEVGDEVVVGFLDEDPRRPVILGMLHSSAKPAPLEGSDDNHEKVYQSRSKLKLYFNDDTKVIRIETPGGNVLTLSDEDQGITVVDQNGNKLELTPDGINLQSDKAISIKAGTELKLEAGTSLEGSAGSDLKLEGSAGAELSSSATTKVSGSAVQIN